MTKDPCAKCGGQWCSVDLCLPATPSNAGSPNVGEGVLLPCPFCGATEAGFHLQATQTHGLDGTPRHWTVECDECEGFGPIAPTKAEADAAWNTRATSLTVPAIPVDRPTLFREIDALGGTGFPDEGESWSRGYSEALSDALAILEKRGFTEAADAASPAYTPRPVEGEVERVAEALFLREMAPFIANGCAMITTWAECLAEYPEQAARHRLEASTAIASLARPVEAGAGKLAEVERLRKAVIDLSARYSEKIDGRYRYGPDGKASLTFTHEEWREFAAALTTPAGGIAEGRNLADRFEWAAPGDQQEDAWLVRFCDRDLREAIYTGPEAEADAWAAWERHSPGYNMFVFRLARLNSPVATAPDREKGA